jgi:hypothetical protein
MKIDVEVDEGLLFHSLEKNPKEPWARFVEDYNMSAGTNHSPQYAKLMRAYAEYIFDLDGSKCGRISEEVRIAVEYACRCGKTYHEVAKFFCVSESTAMRLHKYGVNLELSQMGKGD